jgi:biopolymer transport protein ExbD
MRLTRYRPTETRGLDLSTASMIDVVFLLLIFFLATTTFLRPERQLDPAILVERRSAAATTMNIEPLEIEIVRVEGRAVYRVGATIGADLPTVASIIRNYPDKTAGAWVRMADDVPFGMAALAVNACRESGFEAVSLVPLPTPPPPP